jgi:hypothetical protein
MWLDILTTCFVSTSLLTRRPRLVACCGIGCSTPNRVSTIRQNRVSTVSRKEHWKPSERLYATSRWAYLEVCKRLLLLLSSTGFRAFPGRARRGPNSSCSLDYLQPHEHLALLRRLEELQANVFVHVKGNALSLTGSMTNLWQKTKI